MSESKVAAHTDRLYQLLEEFLAIATEVATRHPMCVVIAMHEYFRSLWPNDPYIPERNAEDPLRHIESVLQDSISFLRTARALGSYFNSSAHLGKPRLNEQPVMDRDEQETQAIYARLWTRMAEDQITSGAVDVLRRIFENNREPIDSIRGKHVLDMGCGSGRFSFALAQLGAARVTGIDLGNESIARARRLADRQRVRNIEFLNGSVLELPFADQTFDFVWCKGVLHHTGNLTRGLDEYFRVLKSGGRAYLYLYGSGGLHWTSRRRMREVMKLIPIDFAIKVLELMGMPSQRYIFIDSWYVPIEEYVRRDWLEDELRRRKVMSFARADDRGRAEVGNMSGSQYDQLLWGDGELRYFLRK